MHIIFIEQWTLITLICYSFTFDKNYSSQSVRYWQLFGVISPFVAQFLNIGQMPHGVWIKPGDESGVSTALYRLIPSACGIRSALPS